MGASLSRHSLREGGRAVEVRKGVGCGQREEQAPVTEQEMAGWYGWWMTPSSRVLPLQLVLDMWKWSWWGGKWKLWHKRPTTTEIKRTYMRSTGDKDRWLAPSVLLIPVKWNLQIQSWFKWKAWVWASCGVRWSWDDSVSSQWASERFIHLLLLSVRSCRSPSCLWPHPPSCMCVCLCVTGQREGKKRSGRAREASSLSHDRTWCEQLVSLKSKALLQTT